MESTKQFSNLLKKFNNSKTEQTENKGAKVTGKVIIRVKDVNFYYGNTLALKNVNLDIYQNKVTAVIGPSGCGKSTLIRLFNRMNELIPKTRLEGLIQLGQINIYDPASDVVDIRRRVGMVFQKPNPFPKSIFENVAFGLKVNGIKDKKYLSEKVEKSLKDSALWNEVKNRLNDNALQLSGGQQQRLCIARTLAVEPEVVLFDEPCSALDPTSTAKIEELILELKKSYTIVIVTHNMQQAARIADFTAFFMLGELIEYDNTHKIYTNPANKLTEDYITGRFG
ncbi:MAG: phosphate ABC transporter ATP-binding protein [Candidatus Omnitrophica bacterium]|nr:phosphate ABC transporter ATP-binding protein [Candidatus Omnitrophota bacterium]